VKKLIKFVLFVALVTAAIGAVASFASRKKFASMSDDEIRTFLASKLEGKVADDQLASIQDAVIAGVRARSGSGGDHYAEDVQEAVEELIDVAADASKDAAESSSDAAEDLVEAAGDKAEAIADALTSDDD
jgi:hypothetical protein